jgi:RNA polymerase sigma-70 factor, ECF subfamily
VPIPVTLPVVSEAELIRRAQQGDAEAFGLLFEKHKARVYALCLRMTRNTAEAEDLTQDAFLHVFRKLSAFRADSALSTWLYRVTVNTVLMYFRKKSLATVSVDQPGHDDNPMPREFPTTDCRLTSCVDRMALNRALGELPNGYRQIFLLHEVAGYEHREIANFLGCSVGNSKSQLHKARQRIRELLTTSIPLQTTPIIREKTKLKSRPARQRVRASVIDLGAVTPPVPVAAIPSERGWATAA